MSELYKTERNNILPSQQQKRRHPLLRHIANRYGNWLEGISLVLLLVTLGIAIRSIEESRWITPQPSLTLVLVISVLAALLLAKSRLPVIAAFLLGLILGGVATIWQASGLLTPTATSETNSITAALQSLWQAVDTGQPNTIYFALFLLFFTWISGFISAWFILRSSNAWVTVILGIITVLVNLRYLTEEYYIYLVFYLLSAMLLIILVSLLKRDYQLGKRFPVRSVIYFVTSGIVLSTLMVAGNWLMPEIKTNELRSSIGARMPWAGNGNLGASWINVFAAVEAKQSLLVSASQEKLTFAGVVDSRRDIQFEITASERLSYWRTRRYDTYNSWGWSNKSATQYELAAKTPVDTNPFPKFRQLTFTVENKLNTDILLSAGEFISSQTPVTLYTAKPGLEAGEIIAMTAPRMLNYGESYTLTSAISMTTPAELAQAGQNYPRSITDRYLQLPSDLPSRVRQVSRTITRQTQTPYDKVLAVINYLSRLSYIESGSAPPQGGDGVDNFIFTTKTGNCTNFASATVVLLRSAGIPARLSTGYLAREWDRVTGASIIRARDYHAWVEVYFPGYGWMEFEATPLGDSEDGGTIAGNLININGAVNITSPEDTNDPGSSENSTTGANNSDEAPIGDPLDLFGLGLDGQSAVQTSLIPIFAGTLVLFLIVLIAVLYRRSCLTTGNYSRQLYARMCFLATLGRLSPKPQQTPSEYSARLAFSFPGQSEAIDNITRAYMGSRFSQRREMRLDEKKRLSQSWRVVSRTLIKRLLLPRR